MASVTAPDRIACAVPFCRRTAARDRYPGCAEIICGKHYRAAPKWKRRAYARLRRRVDSWTPREAATADRLWESIKRAAITGSSMLT